MSTTADFYAAGPVFHSAAELLRAIADREPSLERLAQEFEALWTGLQQRYSGGQHRAQTDRQFERGIIERERQILLGDEFAHDKLPHGVGVRLCLLRGNALLAKVPRER